MIAAVVDASVAVKWVVDEPDSAAAAGLLGGTLLHAPAHWLAEAANVVWWRAQRGEFDGEDAAERVAVLARAPVRSHDLPALLPRAFALALAHRVTVYDSLYVALAERLGVKLVTADLRLIAALGGDVVEVIGVAALG